MRWDLAKLMQEKLAEINKIKKSAFLKDDKSFNIDLDNLLNLDKKYNEEEEENRNHTLYLIRLGFINHEFDNFPKYYERYLGFIDPFSRACFIQKERLIAYLRYSNRPPGFYHTAGNTLTQFVKPFGSCHIRHTMCHFNMNFRGLGV